MQRMKGQINSQVSNGSKEHQQQSAEHSTGEDIGFESWRGGTNTQHHTTYPINNASNDHHYSPYYASTSFQYQTFGAGDGTWSNGTDPVTFLPGYGGQISHDAYGMEGVFSTNTAGSFGNFGQHAFPNYFHGNGDFSAWGTPRKARYEDYYLHPTGDSYGATNIGDGKSIEQGVQGLSIGGKIQRQDQQQSLQQQLPLISSVPSKLELKEPRKITWASVASQPAKLVPPLSSTQGIKKKTGIAPPPIIPGKHNMDIGTWGEGKVSIPPAKASVQQSPPTVQTSLPSLQTISTGAVAVQKKHQQQQQHQHQQQQRGLAPGPSMSSCWNRQSQSTSLTSATSIQLQPVHQQSMHQHFTPLHPTNSNNHLQNQQQHPPQHPNSSPTHQQQQSHQQLLTSQNSSHPVLDELKIKNNYNPVDFDQTAQGARFFVIKSYSEDDIHRSIKYEIWCSTEYGNKRLDQAYREASRETAPLYLFFSVNGSGHFCGMAQMISSVDYKSNSSVWSQDKWKGQFRVRWIYVKDVPNGELRHIKLENNENKSVTNSRDAQEVPYAKGVQVLRILHSYRHSTSIFDDFGHYERRQAEENQRKVPVANAVHHPQLNHRGSGGSGRGSHSNDISLKDHHQGPSSQHHSHHQRRDRDQRGRGRGVSRQ